MMNTAALWRETQYTEEQLGAIYERLRQYEPAFVCSVADVTPSKAVIRDNSAPKKQRETIFKHIERLGYDEDFEPQGVDDSIFTATDAPAGSQEKIEVLRRRVAAGLPLWHNHDRVDYRGLNVDLMAHINGQHNRGQHAGGVSLNCALFPSRAEDEGGD